MLLTDCHRSDLDLVLKNTTPDVKELLKALQLTIEFEAQLNKRYERLVSTIRVGKSSACWTIFLLVQGWKQKASYVWIWKGHLHLLPTLLVHIYQRRRCVSILQNIIIVGSNGANFIYRTISSMIDSYIHSDMKAEEEDDGTMAVLPSSTDLFYFYRETLAQCSKFSTGKALFDLCQLLAKHLDSYCSQIILGGLSR